MNINHITASEPLPNDEHGFAEDAFRRVCEICRQGSIETEKELEEFLELEAAEHDRQAAYLHRMTKYYHKNAAIAHEYEAQALWLMLSRLRRS